MEVVTEAPPQDMLFESMADITKLHDMDEDMPQAPPPDEDEHQSQSQSQSQSEDREVMLREFARKLREVQQKLEYTLEEYEDYRNPKSTGVLGTAMDIADLVACAHRISYTTFAPPEYASGQFPLRGAFPPAPQDEQMRASLLYGAVDLDIGIGISASQSLAMDTLEAIRIMPDEPPQAIKMPPGMQIPQGWRPGMPIELPNNLPPMPPGWKPGDPIPLPAGFDVPPLPPGWKPGDAVVLPPNVGAGADQADAAAKPLPPAPAAPTGPPPGVIHVPFIQLDLNPELQDDYGSDYSDDDDDDDDEDDSSDEDDD